MGLHLMQRAKRTPVLCIRVDRRRLLLRLLGPLLPSDSDRAIKLHVLLLPLS